MTDDVDFTDPRFPGGNFVDWLMQNLGTLDLSPKNIDQIVAIQRAARANYMSGGKARKQGADIKIDLASIGLGPAKAPPLKRRKLL